MIVVGVFIALGADSSWQDREEMRRADAYVDALRADMLEALPALDSAIEFQQSEIAITRKTLETLFAPSPESDSLPMSFLRSATLSIPTGTLDALVQTRDGNLLTDGQLRTSIVHSRSEVQDLLSRFSELRAVDHDILRGLLVDLERLRQPGGVPHGARESGTVDRCRSRVLRRTRP